MKPTSDPIARAARSAVAITCVPFVGSSTSLGRGCPAERAGELRYPHLGEQPVDQPGLLVRRRSDIEQSVRWNEYAPLTCTASTDGCRPAPARPAAKLKLDGRPAR